jgi:hypothetical protein
VRRFRFVLNTSFAPNYRLNVFGCSVLLLCVDCICIYLLCLNFVSLSLHRCPFGLNGGFGANSRPYLPLLLTLSLADYFRFRFGLHGGFAVSYRLNVFGFSALLLFVDCICICLLCLNFVSLSSRRCRFGLNGGFGANDRLDAFGCTVSPTVFAAFASD